MIDKNKKLQELNSFTWKENGDKTKDMKKEERLRKKAEKNKQKLQDRRQKGERKRIATQGEVKEKERLEIDAMNNDNITAKLVQKEGGYTVGTSKHNKKWIQKRVDRYNARVWRGWREKE
ncbi:hypothetical protein [Bacillus thuringiensis]|uniref:hypothetical protein n=1 Tax=Bacillus thuringiensis TaxID=1428 RepID=UPI0020D250F6|nr:hypothetical protein [Bacillus thuringiensis]